MCALLDTVETTNMNITLDSYQLLMSTIHSVTERERSAKNGMN